MNPSGRASTRVPRILWRVALIALASTAVRCGKTTLFLFPAEESGSSGLEDPGGSAGEKLTEGGSPTQGGAAGAGREGRGGGGVAGKGRGESGIGGEGSPMGGSGGTGGNAGQLASGMGGMVTGFNCNLLKDCNDGLCTRCAEGCGVGTQCNCEKGSLCNEDGYCACTEDSCPDGMFCEPAWHRCIKRCDVTNPYACQEALDERRACQSVICPSITPVCVECGPGYPCRQPPLNQEEVECIVGRCVECKEDADCTHYGRVCLDGRCGCHDATDCNPSLNPSVPVKCTLTGRCDYSG